VLVCRCGCRLATVCLHPLFCLDTKPGTPAFP
jgi:hypothetical protein